MADAFLSVFAKVVVPLFFAGMATSALVVIVTVIRYIAEVTSADERITNDL